MTSFVWVRFHDPQQKNGAKYHVIASHLKATVMKSMLRILSQHLSIFRILRGTHVCLIYGCLGSEKGRIPSVAVAVAATATI